MNNPNNEDITVSIKRHSVQPFLNAPERSRIPYVGQEVHIDQVSTRYRYEDGAWKVDGVTLEYHRLKKSGEPYANSARDTVWRIPSVDGLQEHIDHYRPTAVVTVNIEEPS